MENISNFQDYPSTIHNVRLDSKFNVFANSIWEDPKISWAAKGLLGFILSRPPNWSVRTSHLATIFEGDKRGNSTEAIRTMIKELKEEGYIVYQKIRNELGQWMHRYDVYPMRFDHFQKMFPEQVKANMVKPDVVRPSLLISTDKKSTDIINPPPLTPPDPVKSAPQEKDSGISLRSEEEELFAKLFQNAPLLSEKEKKRLWHEYDPDKISNALNLAKGQKIKKSFMGLILNILNEPEKWMNPGEAQSVSVIEQKILQYNERVRKVMPMLAAHNDRVRNEGHFRVIEKQSFGKFGYQQISMKSSYLEEDLDKAFKDLDAFIQAWDEKNV